LSVVFQWSESEMQALVATCSRDECLPFLDRYFPPGGRLLESGCGAGRWLRFYADRGYDITGLELSPETVSMVRRVWQDLRIVEGDCAASPFPDDHFDGVLSFGVVEHWEDGPQKPLRDILRVLKPGGKAFITVPCHNKVREFKRAVYWDEFLGSPWSLVAGWLKGSPQPMSRRNARHLFPVYPARGAFHEYRMSPSQFRREVEAAGFEVIEHVPVGHMDGIYHELNPFGRLVAFREWEFFPRAPARWLNRWLSRRPFAHAHMQAIVARKRPGQAFR
jgi:SAM-dependent methyltransferase